MDDFWKLSKYVSTILGIFAIWGCRSADRIDTKGSELQGASAKVYCGVPKDSDFVRSFEVPGSDTLVSELQTTDLFAKLKTQLSIPVSLERDWLVKAVAPLSMGCTEFSKKGILAYGRDSYLNFSKVLTSLYFLPEQGGMAEIKSRFNSTIISGNASLFPVVDTLRSINAMVVNNPSGKVRRAGEEVIDSNPLGDEEVLRLKDIMEEGILTMNHYDIPWKNAYGEMVTGDFLVYAKGEQVSKLLIKLNDEFLQDSKNSSDLAYIDASARLVRRCIAIHPFHDGNGRSCTLLGVWALAKRNIPHSVSWAGEDVLLAEAAWRQKFREGVEYHRGLITGKN